LVTYVFKLHLVNCAHLKNTQTSSLLVTVKKRAVGKLLT